ncbi:MAG: sodium:proton antiporter NhaD [Proteobacteria bacterium]|nr:sodium:proton antiporter NhaD [Pseudomonadota bacterium]
MPLLIVAIFALGYVAIVFEHPLGVNKSATALLTGVLCWTAYIVAGDAAVVGAQLQHHLGELAGILFFLLGAMTIVELIDAHDGFELITSRIVTLRRRKLLVTIALLAFVLSAVLDNLTTSIVMVALIRKLVADEDDRMRYAGMVIIAANAGGVWSPIGDVTTTMLWVGGQITTVHILTHMVVPALVNMAIPLAWFAWRMRGDVQRPALAHPGDVRPTTPRERKIVLATGGGVLVCVPVFKTVTHLPPFMGILLGLGVLWTVTELIHKRKNDEARGALSVAGALQRVDSPSILFFLGILLAITVLQSSGLLAALATQLDHSIGNTSAITLSIGLSSAVIDNVPLVAAAQGMYSLQTFPTDHHFWTFLAYCAGTGGSILIIGSAAGVAVMGLERISFGWYLRRVSLPALLGYAGGALVYLALTAGG